MKLVGGTFLGACSCNFDTANRRGAEPATTLPAYEAEYCCATNRPPMRPQLWLPRIPRDAYAALPVETHWTAAEVRTATVCVHPSSGFARKSSYHSSSLPLPKTLRQDVLYPMNLRGDVSSGQPGDVGYGQGVQPLKIQKDHLPILRPKRMNEFHESIQRQLLTRCSSTHSSEATSRTSMSTN